MTIHEWNLTHTTSYIDQFGTVIAFNPLHDASTGSMVTTYKDGLRVGGEYHLRFNGADWLMTHGTIEYVFRLTEEGFDLIVGEVIQYHLTRIL